MEVEKSKKNKQSGYFSWLACCTKSPPISSSTSSPPSPEVEFPEKDSMVLLPISKITKRKPAGWKAMPYVLGNETFERLATFGLMGNFMIFLLTKFNMEQASAANVLNIWFGVTNFAPLIGAFISDAYVGRFWTIGVASFASLVGMGTLTLIAWKPELHPPPCTQQQLPGCQGPTTPQLCVLFLALGFLSIATGGIRPCSLPFGVDQFDATTDEGRKGINSFFNWYYTTFTVVLILALTVVVYIQDSVSWVLGFGIPAAFMLGSILLFFFGTRLYVYVKPEGSVFSGIAQAVVSAYKKRKVKFPAVVEGEVPAAFGVLYDPPLKGTIVTKLPLTNQYRCLNKAAIALDGEVNPDGSRVNPWTLCSIQQIEEVKCLIKVMPVWASGIVCFTAIVQQGTFTVSQALKMDRHLGPKFEIPPGTVIVISMITLGLWVPLYDWVLVPAFRRITGHEGGITLLQRIGTGIVFSVLSMAVAGVVEKKRRDSALSHGGGPISVMWLAPQLILLGFCEAFNIIGQIEFYYKEFPENMSSVANALFFCTFSLASYLSSFIVTIVHRVTGGGGRPNWLTNDINAGRVDYFYYVIAGMGVVNFVYFLIVARKYNYKVRAHFGEEKSQFDDELDAVKQ
ncbi:protein NRT1/ PTR FAMILY 2.13-like [Rhododendron vialii]|uniref:protein NRT1/ PTR FAMILY 2.13-like n=1 Tax=Rhododendron vialii TaxID=182163 RepID=UPI00265DB51B|nr:protein NRT1/ PTR FAMILY 2.13-like [Rhododendron vialii]